MNKEQNENLEVKTDNEIFKCPGCGSICYDRIMKLYHVMCGVRLRLMGKLMSMN